MYSDGTASRRFFFAYRAEKQGRKRNLREVYGHRT